MEEQRAAPDTAAAQHLVEAYLDAVKERDLDRCLDFFADDASLSFMTGVFRGKQAIGEWHRERFDAGVELLRINKIAVDGDKVTVEGVVTSRRLRAWKIGKLAGKAVIRLKDGKMQETKFSPKISNPFEGW